MSAPTPTSDIVFEHCGALSLLSPVTPEGIAWVKAHLHVEPWQLIHNKVAIDPRYIPQIIEALTTSNITFTPRPGRS